MTATRLSMYFARRIDELSPSRQFRTYPTLIGVDLARGGGTAKIVRDGYVHAVLHQILRMLLAVFPFMLTGSILIGFAGEKPKNHGLQFAALVVIVLGYVLEIYILSMEKYLDAAHTIPSVLTQAICVIEAHPEEWKDLTRRGRINKELEKVARSYARLPYQLRGGDAHTLTLFRGWGLEMSTSVRNLKQWVAHPSAFTYTDLLHRLSVDLNCALDGRWSEIPRVAPAGGPNIGSPRQRAAWLALGTILLVSAISILVAYSSTFGVGGPMVVSLLGALGLMAMTRGGIPLEGLKQAKGTLDELRK